MTRWKLGAIAAAIMLAGVLLHSMPASGKGDSEPDTSASHASVLVELFTSEGCSSCPAADALLRQIEGTRTADGLRIVAISEHVTYWNHLGWSDPYSSAIYTERQNAYGERLHLDSVYTPQMVINGSEQIVGSDKAALSRALAAQSKQPRVSLRILSTSMQGHLLSISFSAKGADPAHAVEIVAVLADNVDSSSVLRGENSGQTLVHVAVARSMSRIATLHGDAEKTVQVSLPAGFGGVAGVGHHLVLFAQSPGVGPVLGTDTKPL